MPEEELNVENVVTQISSETTKGKTPKPEYVGPTPVLTTEQEKIAEEIGVTGHESKRVVARVEELLNRRTSTGELDFSNLSADEKRGLEFAWEWAQLVDEADEKKGVRGGRRRRYYPPGSMQDEARSALSQPAFSKGTIGLVESTPASVPVFGRDVEQFAQNLSRCFL